MAEISRNNTGLSGEYMDHPDYLIATTEEVRGKIKQYPTRGIVDLSSLNSDQFRNNWAKLEGN